jgi:nucleoside-diphosphate-sugar epimerase
MKEKSMSRQIRNCPVAVVGGAGFLGSHLVEHLLRDRNCDVLVIDNLEGGRRWFVPKEAKFEYHDITGSELHLQDMFTRHHTEYVFNYAALPYIPVSFKRPLRVFDVNAMGALKVMNAAQEAGVKAILQVSSAEIYGDSSCPRQHDSWGNIKENASITPHSSYGASKAAIDLLIQARWKEAKTPCIALRQFNCIGERETHPYVVPEIMSQLWGPYSQGLTQATIRLGNNTRRDFLYAGDAVRMATELLEAGQLGGVYNLGSEESISIYDLAMLCGDIAGMISTSVIQDDSRVRPWEIWHLQSDNQRIYSVINARPTVSPREALERTWAYYKSNDGRWVWW